MFVYWINLLVREILYSNLYLQSFNYESFIFYWSFHFDLFLQRLSCRQWCYFLLKGTKRTIRLLLVSFRVTEDCTRYSSLIRGRWINNDIIILHFKSVRYSNYLRSNKHNRYGWMESECNSYEKLKLVKQPLGSFGRVSWFYQK